MFLFSGFSLALCKQPPPPPLHLPRILPPIPRPQRKPSPLTPVFNAAAVLSSSRVAQTTTPLKRHVWFCAVAVAGAGRLSATWRQTASDSRCDTHSDSSRMQLMRLPPPRPDAAGPHVLMCQAAGRPPHSRRLQYHARCLSALLAAGC